MATYDKCGQDVIDLITKVINKNYPDLKEGHVTVSSIYAYAPKDPQTDEPKGPALKWGGYPAAAVIRITNLKQRVQGMADCEIVIDGDQWDNYSEKSQEALIDHELYHMVVKRDKDTNLISTDDCGRPKLTSRKHDWMIGGFREIAERHGQHALEVQGARHFASVYGDVALEAAPQVTTPVLVPTSQAMGHYTCQYVKDEPLQVSNKIISGMTNNRFIPGTAIITVSAPVVVQGWAYPDGKVYFQFTDSGQPEQIDVHGKSAGIILGLDPVSGITNSQRVHLEFLEPLPAGATAVISYEYDVP